MGRALDVLGRGRDEGGGLALDEGARTAEPVGTIAGSGSPNPRISLLQPPRLAGAGAEVTLAVRISEAGKPVAAEIRETTTGPASVPT